MIDILIRCKDQEEMVRVREEMHNALKGDQLYIDSKIAICDGDDDKSFFLSIGCLDLPSNISYMIDSEDLKKINMEV
jgi:hypothetical protein